MKPVFEIYGPRIILKILSLYKLSLRFKIPHVVMVISFLEKEHRVSDVKSFIQKILRD